MSSSDLLTRRGMLLALGSMGLLAACGFTPAYAPGGPAARLQGAVRVDDPSNKDGFDFVERMEERIGRPEAPRYALSYDIRTESLGVGITRDNAITRYSLTGRIDWRLSLIGSGQTLTEGRAQSVTSYSATGSTVAGLAAEEDASYRLMRILADQIVAQLVASSGSWAGE